MQEYNDKKRSSSHIETENETPESSLDTEPNLERESRYYS